MSDRIVAKTLLDLLLFRHRDDTCVPECKTGPTQGFSHRRFDLWVMPSSWAHPAVSGYEIKVSRSDFLNDNKWPEYLPYCNLFSFVCTWGLIAPEEMPENVGLFYASKNATRLYCKRKPVYRDVEIPEDIWRYVLMSRARIGPEYRHMPIDRQEIEEFLKAQAEDNTRVGRHFSEAIANGVKKKVSEIQETNRSLEARNNSLESENKRLAIFKSALEELGIYGFQDADSLVKEFQRRYQLPGWDLRKLQSAKEALTLIIEEAEKRVAA